MRLPDFGADHVARELRSRYPTLPILICTGFDALALSGLADDIGVHIVEKPVDESSLISILRELMGTGSRAAIPSVTTL